VQLPEIIKEKEDVEQV
jgi:hypothetical protein